ncbi:MAG: methyltransferase [Thermodesulfobacteriota bacterium]
MTTALNPPQVLGLARAFMESRILISGAELDLYTVLADQALTAEEAAGKTGCLVRPLTVLLDALAALGLLVKEDGRYRTEEALVPLLSSTSPSSVLPMILHAGSLWRRWSNLTEVVHQTGPPERSPGRFEDPEALRAFIGAMHVVGAPQAAQVVAEIGSGTARKLLDVGGASGTYTMAFLNASPGMTATLFDRPEVVAMAGERLARAGYLDRVTLVAGDFYEEELPAGHDLALLSAIIHQNGPGQNLELFRKVHRALEPGGRIVIRDHVMKPDRTQPKSGAVFAINMLVGTPAGGTYTFEEIRAWLEVAGFVRVRLLAEGEPMRGLVEAFKP